MFEKLKNVLARVLPEVDMSTVTEDTRLIEDLGFDSLAFMMMSMEIEDAFDFKFIFPSINLNRSSRTFFASRAFAENSLISASVINSFVVLNENSGLFIFIFLQLYMTVLILKLMIMMILEKKVYVKNIVLILLFKWGYLWIHLDCLCVMGYFQEILMIA